VRIVLHTDLTRVFCSRLPANLYHFKVMSHSLTSDDQTAGQIETSRFTQLTDNR